MAMSKAVEADLNEAFVTMLRQIRISKGWTQTVLAKKLECTPSTVSQWESGDSIPHPRLIPKLARLLGLDAMELTKILHPETGK